MLLEGEANDIKCTKINKQLRIVHCAQLKENTLENRNGFDAASNELHLSPSSSPPSLFYLVISKRKIKEKHVLSVCTLFARSFHMTTSYCVRRTPFALLMMARANGISMKYN